MARNLANPILCDSAADLAVFDGAKLFNKTVAQVAQLGTLISGVACTTPARFQFVTGSVSPDNNQSQLVVVPGTNPGSGKWVRLDSSFDLILPITFATATATALATVPAELTLLPLYLNPFWEMITAWAGGIASTIGLTWSNAAGTGSDGGLLGSAAGDGTFPVRSFYRGTPGSDFAAGLKRIVLPPAATIIYQQLVSAHTSGTGNAHVPVMNVFAPIVPVNPS